MINFLLLNRFDEERDQFARQIRVGWEEHFCQHKPVTNNRALMREGEETMIAMCTTNSRVIHTAKGQITMQELNDTMIDTSAA